MARKARSGSKMIQGSLTRRRAYGIAHDKAVHHYDHHFVLLDFFHPAGHIEIRLITIPHPFQYETPVNLKSKAKVQKATISSRKFYFLPKHYFQFNPGFDNFGKMW